MRLRSLVADLALRTLNLRASASSSLRPISTARRRWSSLSQCLILLRARGLFHKRQPVAARLVVFLGNNFDDVAGAQLGAQGRHAAVHLGAHAGVAHLGVDGVGKVDRGAVGRDHHHLPLGREGIYLIRIEVHLQAGEKLVGSVISFCQSTNCLIQFSRSSSRALPDLRRPCTSSARDAFSAMRCISSVRICTSKLVAAGAHHRGVQRLGSGWRGASR